MAHFKRKEIKYPEKRGAELNSTPAEIQEQVVEPEDPDAVHRDQVKREKIPTRADLKTMYHPMGALVMVIPLPDTERIGKIIIPDKARDQMIEGHVVEFGPDIPVTSTLGFGDCVTWAQHNEYQMQMDGGERFVLIPFTSIILRISKEELEQKAKSRGTSAEA